MTTTFLPELGGGGDRQVDGHGGPSDAALGAEDRDDLAAARRRRPAPRGRAGRRRRRRSGSAFSRSRELTWRIDAVSSSLLNGLTRNSRAPASMERRR